MKARKDRVKMSESLKKIKSGPETKTNLAYYNSIAAAAAAQQDAILHFVNSARKPPVYTLRVFDIVRLAYLFGI